MRIAFLVDTFPAISETFILNQITGLMDLGHDITILSGAHSDDSKTHDDVQKYGLISRTFYHNDQFRDRFVRVFLFVFLFILFFYKNPKAFLNSLNFFKYGREATSLNYFYKVLFLTRFGRFDVVQCHYGSNGNLAAILKEIGVPGKVVTMFHGYDIRRGIENGGRIYGQLFKYGDAILSISDYNYKHLISFGADPAKIIAHPVGIDLRKYQLKEVRFTCPLTGSVRIISVCRLVKEKGVADGLQAIAKLVHEHKMVNIEYQIMGDGPLREELEQLADTLKINEYVRFLGPGRQSDVISSLREANIFFLPSRAEALPMVLMEAQAVGLPVVATNVGSVGQIVKDKESGYLVSPQDHDAMADDLKFLIDHPEQWARMGKCGRANIESNFDVTVLNKKLEKIYQNLCAEGKR